MNTKTKILLPLTFLATVLSACNKSYLPDPTAPQNENTHYAKGMLHDVSVQDSKIDFIKDGASDYKIVYLDEGSDCKKGANFVSAQIKAGTGVKLPVVAYKSSDNYDKNSKIIAFGVEALNDKVGLVKTTKNLGNSGYQIKTIGNGIYVHVGGQYSYQQAALCLSRQFVGYERISPQLTYYGEARTKLPIFDIVERPDCGFAMPSNMIDSETCYSYGMIPGSSLFYNGNGISYAHNSFQYVPPETYKESHPNWFMDTTSAKETDWQLCYTAHGSKTEYDALVKLVSDSLISNIDKNPNFSSFTFELEDNKNWCTCNACTAKLEQYGTNAASHIHFLNDVDTKIQAHLQQIADTNHTTKRNIDVMFFAYYATEEPPVNRNNGKITPIDNTVVCHEHVIPYLPLIQAVYQDSFYDDTNESARDVIDGWNKLSDRIYLWLYQTNFHAYFFPYNNFSAIPETLRYVAENGAKFVFNQGQTQQEPPCFGRFKEYLNSIFYFNVNSDYGAVVNNYFKKYFKEASEPMLKYFYEMQDYMNYLHDMYPAALTGKIYEEIMDEKYWPKNILDRWMNYFNEAFELIKIYEESDYDTYKILKDNLTLESIFPRFALLCYHSGKYSAEDLANARSTFISDCGRLGLTMYKELVLLTGLFNSWNN